MTRSLLDRRCPEPHEAPITALAYDPASGASASADGLGTVALFPPGHQSASRLLHHTATVDRALAISPGGSLVAVGDDDGTLAVYRIADGAPVFVEQGEGTRRAVRAVVFSPDGRKVAYLAVDGAIRIADLQRGECIGVHEGFSGHALDWDPTGVCLVAVDQLGQPTLLQLKATQRVPFQLIPGGANLARFSPNGRHVVLLGDGGLTLVDAINLTTEEVRGADQNSGMLDLCFSPQGKHIAVISARSIHYFQVRGLHHVGRQKHNTPAATGVAVWDAHGVAVGGQDARLHRPDTSQPLPPTVCVSGQGAWRIAGHEQHLAIWRADKRQKTFIPSVSDQLPGRGPSERPLSHEDRILEAQLDLEGSVLAILPEGGAVHVYDAHESRLLFQAGADTADTPRLEVALGLVACLLPVGGMRWFDLRNNRTFELEWVQDFTLTGGGTWLAVVSPRGPIHILDPETGEDAMPPLYPIDEASVKLLAFVHRRPELLVLDDDGGLGLYNLAPAARDGREPAQHKICAFHDAEIDALWGLEDGRHAVLRIQDLEVGTATFVTVDLDTGDLVHVVEGMLPYADVDPESGVILQPSRGSAVLEIGLDGRHLKVSRSLPSGEWATFDDRRVIASSSGAKAFFDDLDPS